MDAAYEHLVPDQEASFALTVVDLERFPFYWHFHPEYELTLIRSGSGRRNVGDDVSPFRAGDLVLIGPELPHSWISTPNPNQKEQERSTAIVIQFSGDFLGDLLQRRELQSVRSLLEAAGPAGLAYPTDSADETRRLMVAMVEQDGLTRLISLLRVLGDLVESETTATPLASAGYRPRFDRGSRDRIAAVCAYVQENFGAPIRLSDAAAVACMTPSALSRAFRRAAGRTFTAYVNEVRVGAACRLLIETELPISAIAADSGFSNLANFNRRFRELRLMSPREYRAAFSPPDGSR